MQLTKTFVQLGLCVCILSNTACSLLFVKGPPEGWEKSQNLSCTTSKLAPILDTAWFGWQSVNTIGLLAESESEIGVNKTAVVIGSAALGVLAFASAAHGYGTTSNCSSAMAVRSSQPGWSPAPTSPTPAPPLTPASPAPQAVPQTQWSCNPWELPQWKTASAVEKKALIDQCAQPAVPGQHPSTPAGP